MATLTQLRAAAKQGATIVVETGPYGGYEVAYQPQFRGDLSPWRVTELTGTDRVPSAACKIVWKPGCRKEVHIPTIAKLVKQLFEGTEHQRANMPEHGGWAVTQTYWNMRSVAFVHWAYAGTEADGTPSNMVERRLSPEVRKMHEHLKALGYSVSYLREDSNFFHVLPVSEKS